MSGSARASTPSTITLRGHLREARALAGDASLTMPLGAAMMLGTLAIFANAMLASRGLAPLVAGVLRLEWTASWIGALAIGVGVCACVFSTRLAVSRITGSRVPNAAIARAIAFLLVLALGTWLASNPGLHARYANVWPLWAWSLLSLVSLLGLLGSTLMPFLVAHYFHAATRGAHVARESLRWTASNTVTITLHYVQLAFVVVVPFVALLVVGVGLGLTGTISRDQADALLDNVGLVFGAWLALFVPSAGLCFGVVPSLMVRDDLAIDSVLTRGRRRC